MCKNEKTKAKEKTEATGPSEQPSSEVLQLSVDSTTARQMVYYEMWVQAYMANLFSMFNGTPGLSTGLLQPDFASLISMAANGMLKDQLTAALLTPPPDSLPRPQKSDKEKAPRKRKSGLQATVVVDSVEEAAGQPQSKKSKADEESLNATFVELPKKRKSNNPYTKKNYTQAEFDQAIMDIRCGRLGTRRASCVYGIPRSTLRNKISRLEAADEAAGVVFRKRRAGGQSTDERLMADAVEITVKSAAIDNDSTNLSPLDMLANVAEIARKADMLKQHNSTRSTISKSSSSNTSESSDASIMSASPSDQIESMDAIEIHPTWFIARPNHSMRT